MSRLGIIGYGLSGIIPILVILAVIFFVVLPIVLHQLLKRCDQDAEDYGKDEEQKSFTYLSIPELMAKLLVSPGKTIRQGEITHYDQESYMYWLFGGMTALSLLASFIRGTLSFSFDLILSLILLPIFIGIGKWYYVAIQTVLFRYVAGIKISYSEGKSVFGPLFMLNYIISIVLTTIINKFFINPYYVDVRQLSRMTTLVNIAIFIWMSVLYYLLLKYRYKLSKGESIGKIVIMNLVWFGLFVVILLLCALPVYIQIGTMY